jgi:hypothetical protein
LHEGLPSCFADASKLGVRRADVFVAKPQSRSH